MVEQDGLHKAVNTLPTMLGNSSLFLPSRVRSENCIKAVPPNRVGIVADPAECLSMVNRHDLGHNSNIARQSDAQPRIYIASLCTPTGNPPALSRTSFRNTTDDEVIPTSFSRTKRK